MANKFVDFVEYCSTCKFSPLTGTDEPCNECLTNPVKYEFEDKKAKGVNLRGEPRED